MCIVTVAAVSAIAVATALTDVVVVVVAAAAAAAAVAAAADDDDDDYEFFTNRINYLTNYMEMDVARGLYVLPKEVMTTPIGMTLGLSGDRGGLNLLDFT